MLLRLTKYLVICVPMDRIELSFLPYRSSALTSRRHGQIQRRACGANGDSVFPCVRSYFPDQVNHATRRQFFHRDVSLDYQTSVPSPWYKGWPGLHTRLHAGAQGPASSLLDNRLASARLCGVVFLY